MKLKYYLRGLGIGILVTALVLIAAPSEKEVLSDAEIRERALQLGMVDSSSLTLADMQGTDEKTSIDAENVQTNAEAVTQESETEQSSTETAVQESEAEQSTEAAVQESETVQPSTEAVTQESETVQPSADAATQESETVSDEYATITIKSGANSYTVAKDLEAVGLIEDAKAFDDYLCDNGYSRSISTGTYEIALGSTEEEIAKIISRKR